MISGLDKYAADLTFKAFVRWLCYHNIISGDLNIPYADKGSRHISIRDNFHNFQRRRDILYSIIHWKVIYKSFTEQNKILILKFLFFSSQKYSIWGFLIKGNCRVGANKKLFPIRADLVAPLKPNQLPETLPFMKIRLWGEPLLFVGRKKVFANQGSWWGSRMIGSDYSRDHLIGSDCSGLSDCWISARTQLLPAGTVEAFNVWMICLRNISVRFSNL